MIKSYVSTICKSGNIPAGTTLYAIKYIILKKVIIISSTAAGNKTCIKYIALKYTTRCSFCARMIKTERAVKLVS